MLLSVGSVLVTRSPHWRLFLPVSSRLLVFTCIFITTGITLWHRLVEDNGELLPNSVLALYSNTQLCSQNTSRAWFWSGHLLHILKLSPTSQDSDDIKFTHWTCVMIQKPWVNANSMKNMLAWQILKTSFTLNFSIHTAKFPNTDTDSLFSMLCSMMWKLASNFLVFFYALTYKLWANI